MNENRVITMKDIAKALNVSVATVSRALQDSPMISEEQRKRIQAYAREQRFLPNQLAGSLRRSRVSQQKIIGVIIPQIDHYYFSTILSGIEARAQQCGYQILVAQSGERYDEETRICQQFVKHRVCGVIVSQAKDTTHYNHFQYLIDIGVPLVFYDRICTGINTSRVVVDDYMGAFKAVSHLIDTGCKRIAFYGSPMQLEISKNRYNGYRDAILKHGLTLDESLILKCDNKADAEAITPALLEQENRPDAIFAVNDDTAIGVLYTAKRMGIAVPDELSICGFTNGERAVATDPQLTTVEQRGREVGHQAVDILVGLVEGTLSRDHAEKRIVKTRLIVRGTTR